MTTEVYPPLDGLLRRLAWNDFLSAGPVADTQTA
jgi:hypothetical protein